MRMASNKHTNGRLAARGTVLCRDLEETIRINLEGSDEFCLAAWHRRDTRQLEFTKQTIIAALRPLSLVAVT